MLTNRQTYRHRWKHNLLGAGIINVPATQPT